MEEELKKVDVLDPEQYFAYIKSKKEKTDIKFLNDLYSNSEELLKKFYSLGQDIALKKMDFTIRVLEKEYKLLELGINTFVYREHIEDFISKIENNTIKIIELKKYPRDIPNEIVETIVSLKEKNIFDDYLVVFTDYTGEIEKQVEEERRRKDPIIFGIFKKDNELHNRFYYIGDWEDEYCDLTLEKMTDIMAKDGIKIQNPVSIKETSKKEIEDYLSKLTELETQNTFRFSPNKKRGIFNKIKTFLIGN